MVTDGPFITRRDIGGYDEVTYKPAPGYEYNEEGFHTIPANFAGTTPKLNIRRTASDNLKEGLSLTLRVDDFSYMGDWGENDEWIAIAIWNRQEMEPGATRYGSGWSCLIRGTGDGHAQAQCFWTVAGHADENGNHVGWSFNVCGDNWNHSITVPMDDLNREIYTFEVRYNDGYSIVLNGTEISGIADVSDKLEALNPNGDFWISIMAQSATRDGVVELTITEFNGATPTGNAYAKPDVNPMGWIWIS